jgi:hypothetical protein
MEAYGDCGDSCRLFHRGCKIGHTALLSREMEHMKLLYLEKLHPKKYPKNKEIFGIKTYTSHTI